MKRISNQIALSLQVSFAFAFAVITTALVWSCILFFAYCNVRNVFSLPSFTFFQFFCLLVLVGWAKITFLPEQRK